MILLWMSVDVACSCTCPREQWLGFILGDDWRPWIPGTSKSLGFAPKGFHWNWDKPGGINLFKQPTCNLGACSLDAFVLFLEQNNKSYGYLKIDHEESPCQTTIAPSGSCVGVGNSLERITSSPENATAWKKVSVGAHDFSVISQKNGAILGAGGQEVGDAPCKHVGYNIGLVSCTVPSKEKFHNQTKPLPAVDD